MAKGGGGRSNIGDRDRKHPLRPNDSIEWRRVSAINAEHETGSPAALFARFATVAPA